jgi:hypothetical protein
MLRNFRLFHSSQQDKKAVKDFKVGASEPSKQLLEKSCAAFACATLFAELLKTKITSENPDKILRLFEIMIYPLIWEKRNGVASVGKSLEFLRKFTTVEPVTLFEEKQIKTSIIDKNDILFVTVSKLFLHTVLVIPGKDGFAYNGIKYKKMTEVPDKVEFIVKIKKEHIDINSVIKAYEGFYNELVSCLKLSGAKDPKVTQNQIYYATSIMKCINYFPELRDDVIRIILEHPKLSLVNIDDFIDAAKIFPEYNKQFCNVLLKRKEHYLEPVNTLKKMSELVHIIADREDKVIARACLDVFFENRHIRRIQCFADALCYFPNNKHQLSEFMFNNVNTYLSSIYDIAIALALFDEHREKLLEIVQDDTFKLSTLNDISKALRLFPERRDHFRGVVLSLQRTFLDADRRFACELFPELELDKPGTTVLLEETVATSATLSPSLY